MPPLFRGLDGNDYHLDIFPESLTEFAGALRSTSHSKEELIHMFSKKLSDALSKSRCVMLTADDAAYAVFREDDGTLATFDSHARDQHGNS